MAAARRTAAQGDPSVAEQQETAQDAVDVTASSDIRQAAAKRQAARTGSPEWQRENLIAAYLDERQGFVQRGNDEGVALVDAELKRLGHKGDSK